LAKGRISAQQLKRDPLMEQYIASSAWVKERSRPLLTGLIVVAVVIAASLIFYAVSSRRERSAGEALAEAFRVDQAVVANPLPANRQGYAYTTEDEKHRKAYEAFEKAARDYPSYYGDLARYYAATHQLYFDAPKAEAALQQLAQQDSSVSAQARLALGERYEVTGRLNEALAEYQKLKAKPGDAAPSLIDFNIARTYEAMGKTKEAADLYFSVASQDQGSGLGTMSVTRLTALDPARVEQLPSPEKGKLPSLGGLSLPRQ
jgi:tetratricopeptide (TPR) repeat protein